MTIRDIQKVQWAKEEEWSEKWYVTELTFRAFFRERNPLLKLLVRNSLHALALNIEWYYPKNSHEWTEDKTNASKNIFRLKRLITKEKTLIQKVERIIQIVKKTKQIDISLFKKIEKGLMDIQSIFLIDLGAYIQPVIDESLKKSGLPDMQTQAIKDYFFLKRNIFLYQKEERNLFRIARIYKKQYRKRKFQSLSPQIKQLLTRHWKKFRYLTSNEIDVEPYTVEDFFDKLKIIDLLDKRGSPLYRKTHIASLINKALTKQSKNFFQVASELSYLDNYAGDLHRILSLLLEDLIHEKFKVSYRDITWYSFSDLERLLTERFSLTNEELTERKQYRIMAHINGEVSTFYGKDNFEKIRGHIKIKKRQKKILSFTGLVASKGHVTGPVRIVRSVKELGKIKKGDILVAPYTDPDFTQAMRRCGAIVTNYGGITSHAAIVSREFNIPCIVGSHIATEVLKDGDIVEVDANKGLVTILQ